MSNETIKQALLRIAKSWEAHGGVASVRDAKFCRDALAEIERLEQDRQTFVVTCEGQSLRIQRLISQLSDEGYDPVD